MNIEIITEDDFKHYKAIRDGYIVILDLTRKLIHTTRCPVSNFREKVLTNIAKNGRYYFTDDLVEERDFFKAVKCMNCRPK